MRQAACDDLRLAKISLPVPRDTRFGFRVVWVIYLVSFALPAFGGMPGIVAFCFGGLYTIILVGLPITFPWLANPLLWTGLLYLRRGELARARVCSFLAAILAASFLLLAKGPVADLGVGYWTWLASMVSLALATAPPPDQQAWLQRAGAYDEMDRKLSKQLAFDSGSFFRRDRNPQLATDHGDSQGDDLRVSRHRRPRIGQLID